MKLQDLRRLRFIAISTEQRRKPEPAPKPARLNRMSLDELHALAEQVKARRPARRHRATPRKDAA